MSKGPGWFVTPLALMWWCTVPHSNLYIVVSPLCVMVDYLTIEWLNEFLLDLAKRAVSLVFSTHLVVFLTYERWGVDVVICLEWGADVCIWSSWCHCIPKTPPSLAWFKSRLVLPFWYRHTEVVVDKRPLNGCSSSNSSAHWTFQLALYKVKYGLHLRHRQI